MSRVIWRRSLSVLDGLPQGDDALLSLPEHLIDALDRAFRDSSTP